MACVVESINVIFFQMTAMQPIPHIHGHQHSLGFLKIPEHKYKFVHSQSFEIVSEVITFNLIYITRGLEVRQGLYSTTGYHGLQQEN
jgi:hypothetical protein